MKKLALPGTTAALLVLALAPFESAAYTPDNHERSVREAAALCEAEHATTISDADVAAIARGAREPDDPTLALLEIGTQRFEAGARGKHRTINPVRIAEQSFHGSPNPTRAPYTDSAEDQAKLRKSISTPEADLLPDRFALDVHSYDTNQAMRNKILINASQLLCVSLAHVEPRTSGRKLGSLIHMIGDTYSASHVQRTEPEGSPENCGTEKIEWHFSMDLVVWKNHGPADRENGDWRFGCLVEHAAELMRMWVPSRKAVHEAPDAATKLARANEEVSQAVDYLCENVLREDPQVLKRPSGGAAAGYSIASGSDNWERVFTFWRRRPKDRPIQPAGLTGPDEAQAFVAEVNEGLESRGRAPWFVYPSRTDGDFCEETARRDALPEALRCTPQEIQWAMDASIEVEPLVMPPRSGHSAPGQ